MDKIKVLKYYRGDDFKCTNCKEIEFCANSFAFNNRDNYVCDKYTRGFVIQDYDISYPQLKEIEKVLRYDKKKALLESIDCQK